MHYQEFQVAHADKDALLPISGLLDTIPRSACASASLRTRYPGFLAHTVSEQLFLIAKLFPVCDGSLTVVELAIVGELVLVD